MCLLLVEDDLLLGEVLTEYLQGIGYEVYYASNGSDALEIAESVFFRLVVSDFKMPGMDGYTLCQELERLYNLPGILMSGFIDDEDVRQMAALGFFPILYKPFRPDELERVIHAVLDQSMN